MGDIVMDMIGIFGVMIIVLICLAQTLTVKKDNCSSWFPQSNNQPKREFEIYALCYSAVWISAFAVVIAFKMYERFDEDDYMLLCTTLAMPFLLQPIVFPLPSERNLPLFARYSFKANVWIAIFSFIGNYWYTHYFYNVLKASYTMPSHRLNNVPIALYFATHFYFVLYHTFSNLILRKITTTYSCTIFRTVFFWVVIILFSYFTAFMETLTISNYPDYSFADKYMAYTVGSLFYGLYFIVSYPVFFRLDENISKDTNGKVYTLYETILEAFGASMIVLCLLDFCRLWLGIPMTIPGKLYYIYKKNV